MIGAITGAVGALGNMIQGGLNYGLQKKQFEYQKQLQERVFQREDTAVQRRSADMANAGLSKTLAAGGAASAGPVVQTQAPQLSGMGDVDGVIKGMSADSQINAANERNKLVQKQVETENQNKKTLESQQKLNEANALKAKTEARATAWDSFMNISSGKPRSGGIIDHLKGLPKVALDLFKNAVGQKSDADRAYEHFRSYD